MLSNFPPLEASTSSSCFAVQGALAWLARPSKTPEKANNEIDNDMLRFFISLSYIAELVFMKQRAFLHQKWEFKRPLFDIPISSTMQEVYEICTVYRLGTYYIQNVYIQNALLCGAFLNIWRLIWLVNILDIYTATYPKLKSRLKLELRCM
jgi:hypothetical protein